MTRSPRLLNLLLLAFGLAFSHAWAGDRPTPDSVKDLTLRAAALLADQGADKMRERFHSEGEFKFSEIYVNVIDTNGTWLIYPPNPKNEGKSVLNVKDAEGKFLIQEIIRVAREQGEGWVEYHWLNPANNRIEPKRSYVKFLSDRNLIVYIGLYRQ